MFQCVNVHLMCYFVLFVIEYTGRMTVFWTWKANCNALPKGCVKCK